MLMLYGLLTVMLLGALGLLAIPFINNKTLLSKKFYGIVFFTICFSFGLYPLTGNMTAVKNWYEQGQAHYHLLEKLEQIGGVDGVITQIQAKLTHHPNDAQGWLILSKLYFAINRQKEALATASKAHSLEPDNQDITHFYNNVKNSVNP